jgi:hypothetical protein
MKLMALVNINLKCLKRKESNIRSLIVFRQTEVLKYETERINVQGVEICKEYEKI